MNYILLATDIVCRVQHSPDSAHNLAEMVANLIREERERSEGMQHEDRLQAMRDSDRRRED